VEEPKKKVTGDESSDFWCDPELKCKFLQWKRQNRGGSLYVRVYTRFYQKVPEM
jgi:hypothetical protein